MEGSRGLMETQHARETFDLCTFDGMVILDI
jgi:hypothetical protein